MTKTEQDSCHHVTSDLQKSTLRLFLCYFSLFLCFDGQQNVEAPVVEVGQYQYGVGFSPGLRGSFYRDVSRASAAAVAL